MIAVALFAAFSLSAQEPGRFRLVRPDSTRTGSFRLPDSLRVEMSVPDSLAHMSPWKTDFRTAAPMKVKPAVSMTSVVVIQKENLPSRITVIDNGGSQGASKVAKTVSDVAANGFTVLKDLTGVDIAQMMKNFAAKTGAPASGGSESAE